METRNRLLLPMMGLAALSVLIFSGIGVAALTGSLELKGPSVEGDFKVVRNTAPDKVRLAATAPAGACANCGVVQSIERSAAEELSGAMGGPLVTRAPGTAAAKRPPVFVVRLRMDDGSLRVIQELFAPAFSVGQRVRVVNGLVLASN
jgi:hypothetical protein